MTERLVTLAASDVAGLVVEGSGYPLLIDGAEAPAGTRTIAFGESASAADVAWLRVGGDTSARRTIAPVGDGLWRRAPWPAADDLFGWGPGQRVIVAGDGADPVVDAVERAGEAIEAVGILTPDSLREAAVVVFHGSAGDALPAEAPAVLAAGRILVTSPCSPDFGFRAGIDHCIGPGAGDLADLAVSAIRHPRAFESMRVYGRLTAERHRASRVLAELETDLELGL